jgi:hypothetical protein
MGCNFVQKKLPMKTRRICIFQAVLFFSLFFGLTSCNKDDTDINTPTILGTPKSDSYYFFCYTTSDNGYHRTVEAGTDFGSQISSGSGWDNWNYMSGVQSHGNQYVVMHSKRHWDDYHGKEFAIQQMLPGGVIGAETQSQDWNSNYETFFGFNIGERGFIFGQDSYSGHHWFIQEVNADGTLAANLSSQGNWNNYYSNATPLYVGDQTYLFFQDDNKYWFITHVSEDGSMHDVADGTWGSIWDILTSVVSGGNTYLVGECSNSSPTEWFIQRINSDGTMGAETDRGTWNNYYAIQKGLTIGNQGYLFGTQSNGLGPWQYFFQEITADGKMGAEVGHGLMDKRFDFAIPFMDYNSPGSFRYEVGWDFSSTSYQPSSWSPRYDDSWGGYLKMGGGAALYNIDNDAGNTLDAVLSGIEDQAGPDRFYYKVAWNLDATGKAASMTGTIFGPTIGESQAGAGTEPTDLDNNGLADLILMVVDDPAGANSFRYYVGWNLNHQGVATAWSDMIQGPVIGDSDGGGGAAIGDIDKNGRPDMVLMGIDDPEQLNTFWIVVGKDLDAYGHAASWSSTIHLPCDIGWLSAGGGAALADIDKNGKLDLIVLDIDSPQGADDLWGFIGRDIDINGNFNGWSAFSAPGTGNITSGAGIAAGDINKNGTTDILVMAIDNPYGTDGNE